MSKKMASYTRFVYWLFLVLKEIRRVRTYYVHALNITPIPHYYRTIYLGEEVNQFAASEAGNKCRRHLTQKTADG